MIQFDESFEKFADDLTIEALRLVCQSSGLRKNGSIVKHSYITHSKITLLFGRKQFTINTVSLEKTFCPCIRL